MIFGVFNHFDYSIIDAKCQCAICTEWRATLGVYVEAHRQTGRHSQSCGKCNTCKTYFKSRSAYISARNRREVYCEFSWHAAANKKTWGGNFMDWLKSNLAEQPPYTRGWWENTGSYKSLDYWLGKFDSHMVTVSGSGWADQPALLRHCG